MSSPQGFLSGRALLLPFVLQLSCLCGHAQPARANLAASEIAEQMRQHAQAQKSELKQYTALRHYQVEYRGFSARLNATMDVEANYSAESGKSFRVVSESGSKVLREKVLQRAIESEKEAAQDTASTALTESNYRFQLLGTESVNGRTAYLLSVEPHTATKFLFRGKIWVDTADFAVIQMETEPAKSPSFWIAHTSIHYTSAHADGFWLPHQVRSETKVRIGGTAFLTIDYGTYHIDAKTAPVETALNADRPSTGR
jgi:hypothetical protein